MSAQTVEEVEAIEAHSALCQSFVRHLDFVHMTTWYASDRHQGHFHGHAAIYPWSCSNLMVLH